MRLEEEQNEKRGETTQIGGHKLKEAEVEEERK